MANVLIPRFKYYAERITVSGTNDEIDFFETSAGTALTATVENGTWTYGQLAYKVQVAMNAAGASVYTVTYDYSTRKFTWTSDGTGEAGDFELDEGGATNDLLPEMGITVDGTGALTYTSDTAVPSLTTMDFTYNLRQPKASDVYDRAEVAIPNGRIETTEFGRGGLYTFTCEHETRTVAQNWRALMKDAGARGAVIQFYPDNTLSNYLDVVVMGSRVDFVEMTDVGLYGHYRIRVELREAVPNSGDLDLDDLINRGPTS